VHLIFDLDGTLANIEHRLHLIRPPRGNWPAFFRACVDDLPNEPICETLRMFASDANHHVEIWSGRSDEVHQQTVEWLAKHGLNYRRLRMRRARDNRKDAVVKSEWLDAYIAEFGKLPDLIFDDRAQVVAMWRSRGVLCAQVADGEF
jgi:phosphoglycolate phosphatase-like HAD superfamily hydrolase